MDYLGQTLEFLERQNRELKEKVKRFEDLQLIIDQQRGQEQKEMLNKLHQQQIEVVRQIGHQTAENLRRQIRQLKTELQQMTQNLVTEQDERILLKKQISQMAAERQQQRAEIAHMLKQVERLQLSKQKLHEEQDERLRGIEQSYRDRQQEIMAKFVQKMDELTEKYDDQIISKERIISTLNKRVEMIIKEKQMIEQQCEKMMTALKSEEVKRSNKAKQHQEELNFLKKQNEDKENKIKELQIEILHMNENLKDEKKIKTNFSEQYEGLKKKYVQLQLTKKRELDKEKYRALSICKDLTEHKKYLKGQLQTSKRKQIQYNHSKKLLIGRIKQMQTRSDHSQSNNTSFVDKTNIKTTKKTNLQTYQSVSLDNSYNKDSPVVSSFLKEQKIQSKMLLRKKPLTIDTSSHKTVLRFESADTPCFQSAKEARKTIKINRK